MTGIARHRVDRKAHPFHFPLNAAAGLPEIRPSSDRVRADGLYLSCGDQTFRVRGVTYGSFGPRGDGALFPEPATSRRDMEAIAGLGLNTIRVYDTPPPDLIEAAAESGIRLIVGLHYDDWRMLPSPGRAGRQRVLDAGKRAVERAMRQCAGHPEVLGIAVGNEVPADLVRWYGVQDVEDVLSRLIAEVHTADPAMLATYVNYPTTEFLEVAGQDLVCFNVFLERPAAWKAYLKHLQVVAGERPLLITECGLAAQVHGEAKQAETLNWQLRTADELGVGATVFSWTDEWSVGGNPVTGWGFGVTDASRQPKAAAKVLRDWSRRSLAGLRPAWPTISVVVCAHNEAGRIGACLESLARCDYPDLEVIVCDDGSSDQTLEIARRFPFQVLALPRGGLSRARNAGLQAARGEIIAYLDGDAQCHPDWPYRLALAFEEPAVVAAGGPNLPVPDADFAERVVAACPGGPIHVLLTDDRAEHIPGCNMAIRREALIAVEGFDEVFRSAGDDVDVCWKLQDHGGQVAFAPTAQIRHHRRASVRGYLRQQFNYGRSERMVAGRHPHRFNRLGQARWRGFIYGGQRILPSLLRPVIYHGTAGEAPFQTIRRRTSESAVFWMSALLPLLAIPAIGGLLLAPWYPGALLGAGAFLAALGLYVGLIALAAAPPRTESRPLAYRMMVGLLHVAQPLVRAWGRVRGPRLAPVNGNGKHPWTGDRTVWLNDLRRELARGGYRVRLGDAGDEWDLEMSRLPLVSARVRVAVAWHWTPVVRARFRPGWLTGAFAGLSMVGASFHPGLGAAGLVATAMLLMLEISRVRRRLRRAVTATTHGLAGWPPAI